MAHWQRLKASSSLCRREIAFLALSAPTARFCAGVKQTAWRVCWSHRQARSNRLMSTMSMLAPFPQEGQTSSVGGSMYRVDPRISGVLSVHPKLVHKLGALPPRPTCRDHRRRLPNDGNCCASRCAANLHVIDCHLERVASESLFLPL